EGVHPIRQAVVSHFASHFKASNVERLGVDNLQFQRLSPLKSGSLTKPFSVAEVKVAVWDCDSFKSPGPDGINFGFIKDFWAELHEDVMRLRMVIGSVISEAQTTFVQNRQILDGILIANEVVDEARKSKKELMLFKVDFEKAYDSVD
ncbi:cysteine-rich receptor-like protein kinase, partial [Trifolium medium]|nr:cysteine-rich receptor-like protein kinase [Trifolium medium]